MAELHINVGIVALSRGLITLETFAGAMKSLAQGGQQSLGDLWVCEGRLDAAQLALLLDAIGPTKGRDIVRHPYEITPDDKAVFGQFGGCFGLRLNAVILAQLTGL